MLSYALKATWFALSLSGLLTSLVVLPCSVVVLGGHWIPVTYGIANTTMQAVFCLGMIWKMNPYMMPSGFCRVQAAWITLSWFAMTGLCAIMTVTMSLTILRSRGKLSVAEFHRALEWHPMYLHVLAGCLALLLTIYLVLSLKLHAFQASDGLQCDVTVRLWIRLLGYAGIPLVFAIPSLVLSCASILLLLSTRSHCPSRCPIPISIPVLKHSRSQSQSQSDTFTVVPHRHELGKRISPRSFGPKKPVDPDLETSATAVFYSTVQEVSRSPSRTPASQERAYVIPSPTPSLAHDPARHSTSRVPVSPVLARHSRSYHLPFFRESSSDESLAAEKLPAPSPPPPSFAPHSHASSARTSPESLHMCPTLFYGQPASSTFLASLGEGEGEGEVFWDEATGAFVCDDDDDDADVETNSGSMRWARPSDASDSTKSPELEFARDVSMAEGPTMYTYPKRDAPYAPASPPACRRADVWRTLFFAALLAATQIVGVVTSLGDILSRHGVPSAFGSQHVAIVLFAWAPTIAFGVLRPGWRRLVPSIHPLA